MQITIIIVPISAKHDHTMGIFTPSWGMVEVELPPMSENYEWGRFGWLGLCPLEITCI